MHGQLDSFNAGTDLPAQPGPLRGRDLRYLRRAINEENVLLASLCQTVGYAATDGAPANDHDFSIRQVTHGSVSSPSHSWVSQLFEIPTNEAVDVVFFIRGVRTWRVGPRIHTELLTFANLPILLGGQL